MYPATNSFQEGWGDFLEFYLSTESPLPPLKKGELVSEFIWGVASKLFVVVRKVIEVQWNVTPTDSPKSIMIRSWDLLSAEGMYRGNHSLGTVLDRVIVVNSAFTLTTAPLPQR